jgi:hypothetical protein
MVTSLMIDCDWPDERRRRELYQGSLFMWSPTPSALRMIDLARELLNRAFAPHDPATAQYDMGVDDFAGTLSCVKPEFIHHPECKRLIREILVDVGADPEQVFFDVPRMRSATANAFLTSGIAYAFHPHRDTWYSAPQAQINWWLPIYDIEPGNAMAIFPDAFDAELPNSSETYNYYRWNLGDRGSAASMIGEDHRVQPHLTSDAPLGSEFRVVAPVGSLLAFSGQQLHATVPNTTSVTRYSIDFRTVNVTDLREGLGAPRSDAACTGTTLRDFRRASDLGPLPDAVIEQYDDASALQYAEGLVYRAP